MSWENKHGKVEQVLPSLESSSFDGCLCDPPYGLSFMGKEWDHGVPSSSVWAEVLRILKPGSFLMAFGGTRTFHRLTCAIEDAGFEIRDCCMWLYGSGFPKSLDISKAIDKAAGAERQVVSSSAPVKRMIPGADQNKSGSWIKDNGREFTPSVTAPASDAAKLWDGYGTALKPSWEPCIVAMKPTDGTFAENALKHGVAGIDVNAGRIQGPQGAGVWGSSNQTCKPGFNDSPTKHEYRSQRHDLGRWPGNLILDEEAGALLDEQSGVLSSGANPTRRNSAKTKNVLGTFEGQTECEAYRGEDSGGASRFFYCPKVSTEERESWTNGNKHPTLKPIALCRYLAKLMLPPERSTARRMIVPFSGTGSEMIGALNAGWDEVVGIEKESLDVDTAEMRLRRWTPELFNAPSLPNQEPIA